MDPLVVNGELALYTPDDAERDDAHSWTVASVLKGVDTGYCTSLGYLAVRHDWSTGTGCIADPTQCTGMWQVRPVSETGPAWFHDRTLDWYSTVRDQNPTKFKTKSCNHTGETSSVGNTPGWWQRQWDWVTGVVMTERSYHGETCEYACAPEVKFVDGQCACDFGSMVPWLWQPSFLPAVGIDEQCVEVSFGGEIYIQGIAAAELY